MFFYLPNNSSYLPIVESSIQNLRFSVSSTKAKPLAIITPLEYSHVQAIVICCKRDGVQMKIRRGGYDFEGTSYKSEVPFIILDLRNLRSISVDIEGNSVWVESGATIGDLQYSIAEKSCTHAFPTGNYPGVMLVDTLVVVE
ncbi:unnamed protein product [Coffea canephora]|uniref:FAD-binding PCMH-type domain-containing protein n=1 Tax=Coffea canephora TaxID=49390 RepID=A0A068URC9_COFCA|nr:unnamed protein product [Coffea canephora]